jgi:hypothetical protein
MKRDHKTLALFRLRMIDASRVMLGGNFPILL